MMATSHARPQNSEPISSTSHSARLMWAASNANAGRRSTLISAHSHRMNASRPNRLRPITSGPFVERAGARSATIVRSMEGTVLPALRRRPDRDDQHRAGGVLQQRLAHAADDEVVHGA